MKSFKTVQEWQRATSSNSVLLHLGCGSKYWPGWCNIDANPTQESDTHRGNQPDRVAPDIWSDIRNIPVEHGSVEGIASHHVIEHFFRYEAIELAKYFYLLLKPGGFLIVEMPDLSRILLLSKWLPFRPRYSNTPQANRDIILSQLYGASWEENHDHYPFHKYVWQRSEFCDLLRDVGFNIILQTGSTLSHVPFRDMAVIAQKPYATDGFASSIESEPLTDMLNKYGDPRRRFKRQLISILLLLKTGLPRWR